MTTKDLWKKVTKVDSRYLDCYHPPFGVPEFVFLAVSFCLGISYAVGEDIVLKAGSKFLGYLILFAVGYLYVWYIVTTIKWKLHKRKVKKNKETGQNGHVC